MHAEAAQVTLVVIKPEPEDESPGLAGDDEFDRWTEACAKCGQRGQLGEEMICCEQPTGADPNARDAKGFSPLMWTVPDAKNAAGQIEFAKNLLALGALVDATDNEGLTALWWSCHFCEEQHRKSRNNALSCGPYIFLLICRGADADFIPSSIVPNAVMSSPREMLHRCNLQRFLHPEIIAISDDDEDATRRCSPSPSSAPVAAVAPTSPTGTASPVVSVAAKRSMSLQPLACYIGAGIY
jgi:hypothetical protein